MAITNTRRSTDNLTTRLAEKLELDITCQRLDSTHVFSHMASFGRTKLMAVAIKRFLTQVRRHDHELVDPLPEEFRRRYEPAESQLFSAAKDAESRQRSRQQAAEDLLWVIERFANCADMTGRSTYKALVTIFSQQCEVKRRQGRGEGQDRRGLHAEPIRPHRHLRRPQRPGLSGADRRDVQPGERGAVDHGGLPQSAAEPDGGAVVPMLDQLDRVEVVARGDAGRHPLRRRRERAGGRDSRRGVGGANPGCEPEIDPAALALDDFAVDERTGRVEACPQGHAPLVVERDKEAGTTRIEMAPEVCGGCPFRNACPIHKTRDGRYTLEFTDKAHRLAGRRREQETPVFTERCARRSGIESTNSGLKNRLGLKRLRVRGRGSVFRVIVHKVAGWKHAAGGGGAEDGGVGEQSSGPDAEGGESGPNEWLCALVLRLWDDFQTVFGGPHGRPHDFEGSLAA